MTWFEIFAWSVGISVFCGLLTGAITVLIAMLILLGGCATPGGYWVKVRAPLKVMGIVEVEYPCGRKDSDGCAMLKTGRIEVRRGMSPILRDCVIRHERKHFDGYDHPMFAEVYASDCGDGEMVPA